MRPHLLKLRNGVGGKEILPATGAAAAISSVLLWLDEFDTAGRRRLLTGVAALLGLIVFVLGVGNRFTRGPWFLYIPEVDLVPPLSRAAWQHAFQVHQQSPLYALCGGYQVGGMESLTVYQFLYFWEWLREGALLGLLAALFLLLAVRLRRVVATSQRAAAAPLFWLAGFAVAYMSLKWLADHAGLFATLNFGQHRHAVDVTFASIGLAVLLASLWRPGEAHAAPRTLPTMLPPALVALVIGYGSLLESMDASVLWTSFPGYGKSLTPGVDRLLAFVPWYRNLTENGYLIQAVHRVVSYSLWIYALAALLAAHRRGQNRLQPALLLGSLTLAGILGAINLIPGLPVTLSIAHQVCAVLVLAAALVPTLANNPASEPKEQPTAPQLPGRPATQDGGPC